MTPVSDLDRLGKLLKEARERAGLSQREVAEAAAISPTYIRTLEARSNPTTKKASSPSAAILMALAVALDLVPDELLRLAGHDPASAGRTSRSNGEPAHNSIESDLKRMREAARRMHHRSPFIYTQTVERFSQFTAEFLAMADGALRCTAEEEPYLTRLASRQSKSTIRALSYQDERWWQSRRGRDYLRLQAEMRKRDVEITHIFLVAEEQQASLVETFRRHIELGIRSYVLDPADVDEAYWRDFIIFDEDLLRIGDSPGDDTDRKKAEFIDNRVEIVQALEDFRALYRIASNTPSELEHVLATIEASMEAASENREGHDE